MNGLRILGLIPARGASKGVPEKNVRPLAGKSLIERASEAARDSGMLERVVLSTDDPKAAELGRRIGLEVPFVRPPHLALDTTPMIDVVLHTLDELEARGDGFHAVLLLQPPSPLRTHNHLTSAVRMLTDNAEATAVCSVAPVPFALCPHYLMRIDDEGRVQPFMSDGERYTRRQDVPQAYMRCGTVFLTRVEVLRRERSFYGQNCLPMLVDWADAINIDSPEDWDEAERRLVRAAYLQTA